MPKLITTITKHQDSDPWILLARVPHQTSPVFTDEERDQIVLPFIEFVKSAPGYNVEAYTQVFNGNVYQNERTFDTMENLQASIAALSDSTNPIVAAKNQLITEKLAQYNMEPYTITTQIVE